MSSSKTESLINFNAAAKRLAVTAAELCGIIIRGSIPRPVRIAGKLKFFRSDIDGFLDALKARRNRNPKTM